MKIIKSERVRFYKAGYEVRQELWALSNTDKGTPITVCYNPSGDYIGNPKDTYFLAHKLGIRIFEKAAFEHNVCSIGFNPKKQIWYGWSHRAVVGFKIGYKIFEASFGDDKTPFKNHGRRTIKTLADAKQAAKNFAEYIG